MSLTLQQPTSNPAAPDVPAGGDRARRELEARAETTAVERPTVAAREAADAATLPVPLAMPAAAPGYALTQRLIDVLLAGTLLILAAPILLLIAIAIKLDSDGPVLYRAERMGMSGRRIKVLKFRTMRQDSEELLTQLLEHEDLGEEFRRTFKLREDPRLTRVGGTLRRTSLDELPQFWNVLVGEMAVVGPRPIVEAELDLYAMVPGGQEAYLSAKPGITGLWQISGRSDTSYRKRVMLDRFYVHHRSTAFDLRIIAKTPLAVLSGSGAY